MLGNEGFLTPPCGIFPFGECLTSTFELSSSISISQSFTDLSSTLGDTPVSFSTEVPLSATLVTTTTTSAITSTAFSLVSSTISNSFVEPTPSSSVSSSVISPVTSSATSSTISTTIPSTTSSIISTITSQTTSTATSSFSTAVRSTISATTFPSSTASAQPSGTCDTRCAILASTLSIIALIALLAGLIFFLMRRRPGRRTAAAYESTPGEEPQMTSDKAPILPQVDFTPSSPSTFSRMSTFFGQAVMVHMTSRRPSRAEYYDANGDRLTSANTSRDASPVGRPLDASRPSRGMNWSAS